MQVFFISTYVILTSGALITIKLGSQAGRKAFSLLGFDFNYWLVSGVLMYGISFLIYIYLISKYDLGIIIPLLAAFVYILVFVSSYFILHEQFTILKIVAIVLILLGVILLGIGSSSK